MIYEYFLSTIKLTYFLSVHFMQMAAGFKTFPQEEDSFQKEVYTPEVCDNVIIYDIKYPRICVFIYELVYKHENEYSGNSFVSVVIVLYLS